MTFGSSLAIERRFWLSSDRSLFHYQVFDIFMGHVTRR
jgi:hypothetical protein